MTKRGCLVLVPAAALALSGCAKKDPIAETLAIFAAHSAVEIPADKLRQALISRGEKGLLLADRYAAVVNPQEENMLRQDGLVGIGAVFAASDGKIKISGVYPGSPAERAGLREGDIALAVDGAAVRGADMSPVAKAVPGKEGSAVSLKLLRGGAEMTLSVVRAKYRVPCASFSVIAPEAGYVRVSGFEPGAAADIKSALDKLSDYGVKNVVLDLRFNPGGLLEETAAALKLFCGGAKPLFSTESRFKEYSAVYKADEGAAPFGGMKTAVLINGSTRFAAEIFAASLRENAGARIIGSPSAGFGGVQKTFALSKGMGLKLTVCFLKTPAGNPIEGAGVAPDDTAPMNTDDESLLRQFMAANPGKAVSGDPAIEAALRFFGL